MYIKQVSFLEKHYGNIVKEIKEFQHRVHYSLCCIPTHKQKEHIEEKLFLLRDELIKTQWEYNMYVNQSYEKVRDMVVNAAHKYIKENGGK